jgi:mono/diheme cytochrome c family protein
MRSLTRLTQPWPLYVAAIVIGLWGTVGRAQRPSPVPTLEHIPPPYTRTTDGASMYRDYCAACHGVSGRGDGPAVPALKVTPTDLSRLARNNKGTFPTDYFQTVLQHGTTVAHGTDMPTWGSIFAASEPPGPVQVRIVSLRRFVEQLQVP